jgi:hypothetical protein
MTAAYFEDHPTDPDKVILRKPRHEEDDDIQDYKKPWQPLNWGEVPEDKTKSEDFLHGARWAEKQLRERNA